MVAVKQSSRELHRHHFNGVWYNKNRGSTCQSYKQFNHRRVKCERRSQEQHIILCDLKYGSKIRKLWMTNLMHTVKNPFPTERMKVWKKCISKAQILRALNIQTGNVSKSSRLSLLISLMMCFLKIPTILHINRVHWRHISTNRCSLKQEKYKERKSKEERKRQEEICCIFHNRSISIWNETEKNLSSLKRNYDLRPQNTVNITVNKLLILLSISFKPRARWQYKT